MTALDAQREADARERRLARRLGQPTATPLADPAEPYVLPPAPEFAPDTYEPSDEFVPRFLRDSWRKI